MPRARLLTILDEAMNVGRAAFGKIRVVDRRTGVLTICASRGFSEQFVQSFGVVSRDAAMPSARACRYRRRVAVADIARDKESASIADAARQEGFQAAQSTPILGPESEIVGTLSTHFSHAYYPSQAESLVLDHCARKAAVIVEEILRGKPPGRGDPT